ncbi:LOW QUALITY PROTEIN: Putative fatty acyl-CoA reductase CG5065, partial [Gryllus bimaculatus]
MATSDAKDYISVADFYAGKSVFVTGATGFLGKLLVEKLLWSCPGIENIFLLIRRKRNEDEESRLATVLGTPVTSQFSVHGSTAGYNPSPVSSISPFRANIPLSSCFRQRRRLMAGSSQVFDRLRKYRPNDLKKIVVISGDLSKPFLSISLKDQEILIRTASIVFHVAATVRFNEPLKESVTVNTTATKYLAEFCSRMPNIKAFVYISTAYSNCDRDEVGEEFYNAVHDPETIIRLVEVMDGDIIDALTPKLLGKRPNTYTYTKALAENVLQEHNKKLPIVVVRPSIGQYLKTKDFQKRKLKTFCNKFTTFNTTNHIIVSVLSTINEPMPGWIDSWNGPSPFVAAGAKGLLHGMAGDASMVADVIPADIVVNLTICAAWRTALKTGIENIEVYNCCTGERNPVTWGTFLKCCYEASLKNPPDELISYPFFSLQRHQCIRFIQKLFFEQLPAFFIDLIYHLAGKKAIMLNIHAKLIRVNDALLFALLRQWKFRDNNTHNLLTFLKKEDQQIFPFDVCNIDWPSFLETYYLGIRHYLLKDSPNS